GREPAQDTDQHKGAPAIGLAHLAGPERTNGKAADDIDAEDGFSGANYFPDGLKRPVLYAPPERGFERELKKRIDFFAKLRVKRGG
ncbi:MAG: hypothetical protein AAFW64_07510, partial [Pseudomonadota bacterium]